jgi:hypothetical protein
VRRLPRPGFLTGTARRLAGHGRVWLCDPQARREERAATPLVVFILFFPLIVGAFGFGVDHARNVWIRTSIQNAVDSAAVGGAAVTKINTRTRLLEVDKVNAPGEMRRLYAFNRADNPGLICIGDRAQISGTTYTRCWRGEVTTVTARSTLFKIQERSNNAFLGLLGQPTQTYNLQGKAKVNLATQ